MAELLRRECDLDVVLINKPHRMGHKTNVVVVCIQSANRKQEFTVFRLDVHNHNICLVSHPVGLDDGSTEPEGVARSFPMDFFPPKAKSSQVDIPQTEVTHL